MRLLACPTPRTPGGTASTAQAVKELAHIESGHTADGYDYLRCRGRAEAAAESVAHIPTVWAGLNDGACTVPNVAAWSAGDTPSSAPAPTR